MRLCTAFLLGILVGILHEFLRPLRVRRSWPADLLLGVISLCVWGYLALAICGANPRIWDTLSFFAGIIPGIQGPGRLLFPIFRLFWLPAKYFRKIIIKIFKFLYAKGQKWGTMYRNTRRHSAKTTGGDPHDPSP